MDFGCICYHFCSTFALFHSNSIQTQFKINLKCLNISVWQNWSWSDIWMNQMTLIDINISVQSNDIWKCHSQQDWFFEHFFHIIFNLKDPIFINFERKNQVFREILILSGRSKWIFWNVQCPSLDSLLIKVSKQLDIFLT